MTIADFRKLVATWCQSESKEASKFSHIQSLTNFLEEVLYEEYEPTKAGDHGNFGYRLARWIGNAETESHRKALFLILGHLIFFGRDQMQAGYLTAFSKNVLHWLLATEKLPFFREDTEQQLRSALSRTVFTEITDSFGLTKFLHLNNVDGHKQRYTWEQHKGSWRKGKFLRQVMGRRWWSRTGKKDKLVLFEDFVGSGSQMKKAAERACSLSKTIPVLLCPIVICPGGAKLARSLARKHAHLTFSPVIELPERSFLGQMPIDEEHPDFDAIRTTLISLHPKVRGTHGSWLQATSPFGYRETGAIFCKHDNCPDNTLPAIHHESDLDWKPLFHRTSREPV